MLVHSHVGAKGLTSELFNEHLTNMLDKRTKHFCPISDHNQFSWSILPKHAGIVEDGKNRILLF